MRRYDRGETGDAKGFRIIEPGGRYLEPLTPPPPPRAPEPYKVAPPSSALGRAHRRSSFVIIAETRPTTPNSISPSPTLLPTGRVSPFRGRGFKGPPPHGQSRPQSPEIRPRNDIRSRYDRRPSVSQQNSPRRSLIPQPTRRRSVSLTKNGEAKSSPKFGRRAQNGRRNVNGPVQLSISTGNISRRGSLKAPDLSPIQGTPTKPIELDGRSRNRNFRRNANAQGNRGSPMKSGNTLMVPRFIGNPRRPLSQERSPMGVARESNRRFVGEKGSSGEDDSRTKIPTRRGSVVSRNGMNPPSSRFISKIPPKQLPRPIKAANDSKNKEKEDSTDSKNTPTSDEGANKENETKTGDNSIETRANEPSSESKSRENDLGLMDLLKNTSAATGTSSVVGTTTTTAVQPLQIEATAILLEKEGSKNNPASGSVEPSTKPSTTEPPKATSEKKVDGKAAGQKNPAKSEAPTNSAPKKESNATSNGAKEKTLAGASGTSKKNLLAKNGAPETIQPEPRVASGKAETRANNSSAVVEQPEGKSSNVAENPPGKSESAVTVENAGNPKSETREKTAKASIEPEKTLSGNVGGAKNIETTNAPVRVEANGADNKSRPNGSENSVKSSNGLSNVSVDSIRSTDTGVSVDTVRGVSSAREKKGMHMMKRPEEIETLSGNIMHLERNGEPAVLDITGEAPEQDQTRLGRFKKSLTRFRDRFTSMRCLGCRQNQKGKSWLVKQRNDAQNESTGSEPGNAPRNVRFSRMWTSCRSCCRCARLRECQCCRRAARVTPAESTPCCPPERGCGAICGRIFSRCKCKKSEAQHTRSIRAKHSLTSVAPPPLSEEQRLKIPEVLVEHNSVMRGAIPCLPIPIAWFCLVWNVLLPGSGTIWSGLFNLCVGQPRFSISATPRARFGALVVNLIVGVSQFFTVLFCLVGWGWSIWWGVTMIRLARKYKRFRASEAANADLEARNGEQAGLPNQPARGVERTR